MMPRFYDWFVEGAGKQTADNLRILIESPDWKAMDAGEKRKLVKKITAASRRSAKDDAMNFGLKPSSAPPPGFVIPPPPEGFVVQ